VVTTNLPPQLRKAIRQVFWHMHETVEGQNILAQGQIMKMVQVKDRDYDPIRDMARVADQVIW